MVEIPGTQRFATWDLTARVVSYVVSPILVPLMTTGILLLLLGADADQALAAFAFIGFAFAVVPLVDILWMVARGFATSVDLPDRTQRVEPLTLAIVGGLAGLLLYYNSEVSIDLVAILAATYVANLAIVLVVNAFWKISVHATAVGGMLGVTAYVVGPIFGLAAPYEGALLAALVALVPLVMWARVQLRAHTMAQVVSGALLGLIGHWMGFYFGTLVLF